MPAPLPDFHPMTVLRDWGGESPGAAFRTVDATTGVICFGATGSGKTSGISKHLAQAYLAFGFGGIVLCAKNDEREQWEQWAEAAGRWDRRTQQGDLVIFDKSGKWRFNFLDYEASRAGEGAGLTINLVAMLSEIAGAVAGGAGKASDSGGDNKFFSDALQHLLGNLVDLPLLAHVPVTLPLLRSILNSAAQTGEEAASPAWRDSDGDCATILRAADAITKNAGEDIRADFEECRSYWLREFPSLSEKTRSIITLSLSMMIRPLLTRPLRKLFCTHTNVTPEDSFTKGKVVIVDLPVAEFRLAGRIANLAMKYAFQVATLRRPRPVDGTYLRPVFLWADEAQNFVTEFDAEYQAVARSAAGCTVYLVQNRESLLRALYSEAAVDSLLGNLQCKCFAQNSSPSTNDWASKLLGERWKAITGINTGSSTPESDAGRTSSSGITRNEQQRKYVEPAQFTTLKRGGPKHNYRVEVIIYNGGQLYADPHSQEMLPYVLLPFKQLG